MGDTVNVTSPEYPQFYPDNLDLTMYFVSDGNGSFIIDIHELVLVIVAEYYYDYFTIGIGDNSSAAADSVLFLEDSFASPGTKFVITSSQFWIRLQTDFKFRNKGFHATVKRIEDPGKYHRQGCLKNSEAFSFSQNSKDPLALYRRA